MRYGRLGPVVFVVAMGTTLGAGAASGPQDDEKPERKAEPPAVVQPPPLERGQIVIKPTGRKRVTRVAPPPKPAPAPEVKDLPYEGPGPRSVTIGYLVRDPIETGWGPQVHGPAYPEYYGGNFGYGGFFGYSGSCYTAPSYCREPLLMFGGSSYCGSSSSSSITSARRGR